MYNDVKGQFYNTHKRGRNKCFRLFSTKKGERNKEKAGEEVKNYDENTPDRYKEVGSSGWHRTHQLMIVYLKKPSPPFFS